jgi:hypothetical protein
MESGLPDVRGISKVPYGLNSSTHMRREQTECYPSLEYGSRRKPLRRRGLINIVGPISRCGAMILTSKPPISCDQKANPELVKLRPPRSDSAMAS